MDKVVDKEEETPQPGLASAQDWGSSATPSKVGRRRGGGRSSCYLGKKTRVIKFERDSINTILSYWALNDIQWQMISLTAVERLTRQYLLEDRLEGGMVKLTQQSFFLQGDGMWVVFENFIPSPSMVFVRSKNWQQWL